MGILMLMVYSDLWGRSLSLGTCLIAEACPPCPPAHSPVRFHPSRFHYSCLGRTSLLPCYECLGHHFIHSNYPSLRSEFPHPLCWPTYALLENHPLPHLYLHFRRPLEQIPHFLQIHHHPAVFCWTKARTKRSFAAHLYLTGCGQCWDCWTPRPL